MTDKLTWNDKGVERMEYFVAEGIMNHILDTVMQDWSREPGNATDELRSVREEGAPDWLAMTPTEAGIVMASMMRDHLAKFLVPDIHLHAFSKDAIQRAIKDEEYDRMHKEPEEYQL